MACDIRSTGQGYQERMRQGDESSTARAPARLEVVGLNPTHRPPCTRRCSSRLGASRADHRLSDDPLWNITVYKSTITAMFIILQFTFCDARRFSETDAPVLNKPDWQLPLLGRDFI